MNAFYVLNCLAIIHSRYPQHFENSKYLIYICKIYKEIDIIIKLSN